MTTTTTSDDLTIGFRLLWDKVVGRGRRAGLDFEICYVLAIGKWGATALKSSELKFLFLVPLLALLRLS